MRNTYTSKQTSQRSTHIICRIFWNIFIINKQNPPRCTNQRIQYKILQQNSLQLKFEITVKLNNIVQHPFPLSSPNITAQSLSPPFITTEVIYKYDRCTKNTIGYITFYNP